MYQNTPEVDICYNYVFTSSFIQTLLSVPEFPFCNAITDESPVQPHHMRVADYTAGWDLHPTPKIKFLLLLLL